MRQVLLVIVLVGAAFGGGALVSGPGFRWAQEHLLDYMGLKDGGEIDSLDLTPPPGAANPTAAKAASEPLVGAAAVAARSAETPKPAEPPPPAPAPAPKVTEPFVDAPAAQASPAPVPAKAEPPALLGALTSVLSPPTAPAPGAAPAGSTRPPADTPAPTPAPVPAPVPAPAPAPLDPGVATSGLPTLEAAPTRPASGPGGDWAEIRRKLTTAGVVRYTIEGEPGGRVVFACLIPLAGKQAVSQRFEAEGADEFQAAQAVLKRINLWRASHAAAPEVR
ncbi:hypothetical protein [Paludisphaera mucosa]|uniref:Uncharacterized protein n=1 Tax=Paludisphaera mucosa TaxID=3030827 RepID=A0ABT6FJH0_9BACT|nr:hypothetical protein [Paludisphaera mucosa]MDG3007646.1 hypothetical protein [Paludisphaera mucosa]